MTKYFYSLMVLLAAMALATGCGGNIPIVTLDTSILDAPFASSPAKEKIDMAVSQFSTQDYAGGLQTLAEATKTTDLEEAQLDALWKMLEQIQKILSQNAEKTSKEAWDASRDLANELSKKSA